MRQDFESEESGESLSSEELLLALEELQARSIGDGGFRARSEDATVDAVAEATGYDRETVFNVLSKLRKIDEAERLSKALREIEESTHRVDRPGHPPPDPVAARLRTDALVTGSMLDDLPNADRKRSVRRSRIDLHKETKSEFWFRWFVWLLICSSGVLLLILLISEILKRF